MLRVLGISLWCECILRYSTVSRVILSATVDSINRANSDALLVLSVWLQEGSISLNLLEVRLHVIV